MDDGTLPTVGPGGSVPFFLLDACEEIAQPGTGESRISSQPINPPIYPSTCSSICPSTCPSTSPPPFSYSYPPTFAVFLFGKIPARREDDPSAEEPEGGRKFVSCCAVVRDMHRSILVVPKNLGGMEDEIADLEAQAEEDSSCKGALMAALVRPHSTPCSITPAGNTGHHASEASPQRVAPATQRVPA